jgi:iron complex outermembrane recepter protein
MGQCAARRSGLPARAALFVSVPAVAQQIDAAGEQGGGDIVAAGSHIAVSDHRSNSPLSTTDAEELRLQGTVNVEDALVEIPQATPGVSSTNNNGSNGATTVKLRGLGDGEHLSRHP